MNRVLSVHFKWLLGLMLWVLSTSVSCQTLKQDSVMQNPSIRFLPEIFNELELGYLKAGINPCSPLYPESAISHLRNELRINAPEIIIYSLKIPIDSVQPVIPVCIASVITLCNMLTCHLSRVFTKFIIRLKVLSQTMYRLR